MENFFLQAVVDDLSRRIVGTSIGRVWQPSEASVVIDLRLADGRFLLISVEPSSAALFLTSRTIGEIERRGAPDRAFAALLRKRLRGASVEAIAKPKTDRIVTLSLSGFAPSGERERHELIVALTGRSANAYLVDSESAVLGSLRPVPENQDSSRFRAPARDERAALQDLTDAEIADLASTSADLAPRLAGFGRTLTSELDTRASASDVESALMSLRDDLRKTPTSGRLYTRRGESGSKYTLATFALQSAAGDACETFADPSAAADARDDRARAGTELDRARGLELARARTALARSHRLLESLARDLAATEGADRHREIAESLLAQIGTARRVPDGIEIVDLYSSDSSTIVVTADRSDTPPVVAERLFAKHRKARRTRKAVDERSEEIRSHAERLAALEARLASAPSVESIDALSVELDSILGVRKIRADRPTKAQSTATVSGARRFVSSDGFEVLVGRSSAANDTLTFKIAKSSDVWLHAADYPGSHVVIRNPGRAEVPHRTLIEAAQLAAYYSDARGESLADVRYTPRRFVTKPRGAPAGLVRLSRFKTVAVKPAADLDRAE